MTREHERLKESRERTKHWKRWGPYVSERAWGTVREDYSADGDAWRYFPHDHARSRAYRWNEDGLAGVCDRHQEVCLALALWNGRDAILKERLFGLSNHEGNHGEDVKEYYFDVFVEYAKVDAEDLLMQVTVHNRGPDTADLHLLPTLWFRNTWAWGGRDTHGHLEAHASVPGAAAIAATTRRYGHRWLYAEG